MLEDEAANDQVKFIVFKRQGKALGDDEVRVSLWAQVNTDFVCEFPVAAAVVEGSFRMGHLVCQEAIG